LSITEILQNVPEADAESFPKHVRLRTPWEFKKVYEKGERRASNAFLLFAIKNGLEYSRFGLTTPRKLGKAHDRNRVKRRVREILRRSRKAIPDGYDFVVNPRRSVAERDFDELRKELTALLAGEK